MSTSNVISPGELALGQHVTILEWIPWEVPASPLSDLLGGCATTTKQTDFSWCGDVLKVEAIDLPYVIVSHPNESFLYSSNTKLDTRRVRLKELSKEYVEAARRRAK